MYFFSHQNISLARSGAVALFVLLLNLPLAFAQNNAQNNSNAEAEKNPVLSYQSVIGTYQSYQDQPVSSWREINDEVGKIGGWRAYAREASESETSQSEADQAELKDKHDALPAKKGSSKLQGGSHE